MTLEILTEYIDSERRRGKWPRAVALNRATYCDVLDEFSKQWPEDIVKAPWVPGFDGPTGNFTFRGIPIACDWGMPADRVIRTIF